MRNVLVPAVILVLAGAGCGGDEAVRPPEAGVSLTLTEVSSPGSEFTLLDVRATNIGSDTVYFRSTCTPFIQVGVRDAQGTLLLTEDPCGPIAMCPDFMYRLEPGESLTRTVEVGRRWILPTGPVPDCTPVPLDPGVYEVGASFTFHRSEPAAFGSGITVTNSREVARPAAGREWYAR